MSRQANIQQAGKKVLESLPSPLGLNFSFVDLDAGFDCFKRTGAALPDKTVDILKAECDGALFGAVRYDKIWITFLCVKGFC